MKAIARSDRTHKPFDETYWVSRLRENFTSGSDGEGLETGRRSTLIGHEGGNPGHRQEQSCHALPRQSFTRQLVFKSSKRSFNLDKRLTSNNALIIESLILSSIIAGFACSAVLELGAKHLTAPQRLAMSFQRAAQVVVQLATEFIHYITQLAKGFATRLVNKIQLFAPEFFEKNHHHRPTTLARVHAMLEG